MPKTISFLVVAALCLSPFSAAADFPVPRIQVELAWSPDGWAASHFDHFTVCHVAGVGECREIVTRTAGHDLILVDHMLMASPEISGSWAQLGEIDTTRTTCPAPYPGGVCSVAVKLRPELRMTEEDSTVIPCHLTADLRWMKKVRVSFLISDGILSWTFVQEVERECSSAGSN